VELLLALTAIVGIVAIERFHLPIAPTPIMLVLAASEIARAALPCPAFQSVIRLPIAIAIAVTEHEVQITLVAVMIRSAKGAFAIIVGPAVTLVPAVIVIFAHIAMCHVKLSLVGRAVALWPKRTIAGRDARFADWVGIWSQSLVGSCRARLL